MSTSDMLLQVADPQQGWARLEHVKKLFATVVRAVPLDELVDIYSSYNRDRICEAGQTPEDERVRPIRVTPKMCQKVLDGFLQTPLSEKDKYTLIVTALHYIEVIVAKTTVTGVVTSQGQGLTITACVESALKRFDSLIEFATFDDDGDLTPTGIQLFQRTRTTMLCLLAHSQNLSAERVRAWCSMQVKYMVHMLFKSSTGEGAGNQLDLFQAQDYAIDPESDGYQNFVQLLIIRCSLHAQRLTYPHGGIILENMRRELWRPTAVYAKVLPHADVQNKAIAVKFGTAVYEENTKQFPRFVNQGGLYSHVLCVLPRWLALLLEHILVQRNYEPIEGWNITATDSFPTSMKIDAFFRDIPCTDTENVILSQFEAFLKRCVYENDNPQVELSTLSLQIASRNVLQKVAQDYFSQFVINSLDTLIGCKFQGVFDRQYIPAMNELESIKADLLLRFKSSDIMSACSNSLKAFQSEQLPTVQASTLWDMYQCNSDSEVRLNDGIAYNDIATGYIRAQSFLQLDSDTQDNLRPHLQHIGFCAQYSLFIACQYDGIVYYLPTPRASYVSHQNAQELAMV